MQENTHKEKSALDNLKPRAAFKVGLLSGLAVMFVIGFLILAGVLINGGDEKISKNDNGAVVNQPTNPGVAQPPANNNGVVQPVTKDDWVKGDKNAKISIVEYSDTECPFCKRFHPTAKKIVEFYEGKVNWVYRHFPLGFHNPLAQKEAEATECANELGGNVIFWKYADLIYERTNSNGNGLPVTSLAPLAQEIGLDEEKFTECLESGRYTERVQEDFQEGSKIGITGTPGNIFLHNKTGETVLKSGAYPFDELKIIIDKMLK